MWFALRKLMLGMALIAAASAVLLLSDWKRRIHENAGGGDGGDAAMPQIAILQLASRPIVEENVGGMIEGLAREGFIDGKTASIRRFNAENDLPTANMMAKEIISRRYRLVMTSTTPCLQCMANANKAGKVIHVFGGVTDPYGAGVGITGEAPSDHPRHLVGIGTFQPVGRTFEIARQLNPGLKKVGVVWNPGETCSEACLRKARPKCEDLGIELLEATVDSSAAVQEAAKSVVARGAEALWLGGDNTVDMALDALVAAAREGKIPVFTNDPRNVDRGVLFGLGADYFTVGALAGQLAGRVLKGTDPTTIPVKNCVPENLRFNTAALSGLKAPWSIPADLMAKAKPSSGEGGGQRGARRRPDPGRTYRIGLVYFAPDVTLDVGIAGLLDGLRDCGFAEGKNLEVRKAHAHGEIANITSILTNDDASGLDLIVVLSTPCLTAACVAVKKTPVVFTCVFDPIAAGAGKSPTDHVPHVTGVGSFPPIADMVGAIKRLVPGAKAVGTLYNAAEANSQKVIGAARGVFRQEGIRLEEATVANSSEVYQAAQALSQKGIGAIWIGGDNTAYQALGAVVKAATAAKLPLVIDSTEHADRGAVLAYGVGAYPPGYAGGEMAARVLLGEDPSRMPFENVAAKQIAFNLTAAKALGMGVPESLLGEGEMFLGVASRFGRPAKVAFVQAADDPPPPQAYKGALKGLEEARLALGTDFVIRKFSAQGDPSRLSSVISAVQADRPDLVMTAGTAAMQAAARSIRDIPIVFALSRSPEAVGALDGGRRPANLTGIWGEADLPTGPTAEEVDKNCFEWGRQSARLAAKVLAGVRPASLPMAKAALRTTSTDDDAAPPAGLGKMWKLVLVCFGDTPHEEDGMKGLRQGLADAKLAEGRDYTLQRKTAQGDMATLNMILSGVRTEGADLVVVFTTPALQAAVRWLDKTPTVFSIVANAVLAGAGKSETDHRSNVTGITTLSGFAEMAKVLKECMPGVRRVGTVFAPAEVNSVYYKEILEKRLKEAGVELVAMPASTSAEVADAAMALCSQRIDALCQISDNLTGAAYMAIIGAAEKRHLPVFGFVSAQARCGAVLAVARDFSDAGREAALVAARVMRGEDPARIPFQNVRKTLLIVNLRQAQKLGVRIPEDLLLRADEVIR